MKHLIYFLLFSTAVFSQNYQYAIEVVPNKTLGTPTDLMVSQITENTVDLAWVAPVVNLSIKDYEIYNNGVLLVKSIGTVTNYQLKGLTSGISYSLTVRAVDNEGNISGDSNMQEFRTLAASRGVNNQLEEIEYFKAYLLPLSQKATIQKALDTYGSVRLEKGDYSGVDIVMKSNQRLYGHSSLTKISNVSITGGSSNVVLESLIPRLITLRAGGVISNCTIKTIKHCDIVAVNAMLENNLFINIMNPMIFDCSTSGYFRNNKIIRHQSQTMGLNLVMKGNSTTPSYGNVNFHSNYLTPGSDVTEIEGLQSATFVGIDSEGWNLDGNGTKAMFDAKKVDVLKVTDMGGDNAYSPVKTPAYNIDADYLFMINKGIGSNDISTLSLETNAFITGSEAFSPRESGKVTGFDLIAHNKNGDKNQNDIKLNGNVITAELQDPTYILNISKNILGVKHTPWARPNWEKLPDPLGSNWRAERVGKPDSRGYIQNLINTKGIAELPEGIFYIGSTIELPIDGSRGIIGAGTGKTIIVGLTDDFPLITLKKIDESSNFHISNLTLQGGSVGIYAPDEIYQIAILNMKYVTFRDQNYGIHLHWIFGLDNCFFDHLSFVNCKIGFFQDPNPVSSEDAGYVDKVLFYGSQFLDCATAVSMKGTRANNLNAWFGCKFDGGNIALDFESHNFPIIANCDFTNFNGTNVISSNHISLYNNNFYNNSVKQYTIKSNVTYMEGCNLLDNSPVFSPVLYNPIEGYVFNSTITGNVLPEIPQNQNYGSASLVLSNNKLIANPTLSKLLVNVKAGVSTVIIDEPSDPYPQLLVTQ